MFFYKSIAIGDSGEGPVSVTFFLGLPVKVLRMSEPSGSIIRESIYAEPHYYV